MRENGFSLTRVLSYKDRIVDENLSKNLHSRIFYAVEVGREEKRALIWKLFQKKFKKIFGNS